MGASDTKMEVNISIGLRCSPPFSGAQEGSTQMSTFQEVRSFSSEESLTSP